MKMKLCKRCHVRPGTHACAGMLFCPTCAATASFRYGATVVGVATDPAAAQPAGYLPDPYSMGQQAGQAVQPLTPYGLGQQAGQAAASAAPNVGEAIASTASTVRTAIVVAGVVGVAAILYIFYNAQKTSARALDVIEHNPNLLAKAGVVA